MASRKAVSLMGTMLPENIEDLWIFSVLTVYFGKYARPGRRSFSIKHGVPRAIPASLGLPSWLCLPPVGDLQVRKALARLLLADKCI